MFWEFHTNKSHLVDHLKIMNGNSLYFIDENVNKFLSNKVMLVICGYYTWNKTFYSAFVSPWNKKFWNKIGQHTYKKSVCVVMGDCSETEGNSEIGGKMFSSSSHPILLELTFLIKNKCKILHETIF